MSAADEVTPDAPVSLAETQILFAGLENAPALVLAVSGGPDSSALLILAARWRKALRKKPRLIAVTIDHGLRPQSAGEAKAVARLARRLSVPHRTLRWTGEKPTTGLQEKARNARYRLLAKAAAAARARHILTAHTLDDQAETVLIRMARGSGLSGLCGMARETALGKHVLMRPLLGLTKARLLATLAESGVSFVDDPSNADPRFLRSRLRRLMPSLEGEGLGASRLALLAHRMRRAEAAIEAIVNVAAARLAPGAWTMSQPVVIDRAGFSNLPAEIALRLLGQAIAATGDEGPVELAKLERLFLALPALAPQSRPDDVRFRRTLAGALITVELAYIRVERAPPRSSKTAAARRAARTRTTEAAQGVTKGRKRGSKLR